MHNSQVIPIRITVDLMRTLRTRADHALIFGEAHAAALEKLLTLARKQGQDVDVVCLNNGKRETLVARVVGSAGDWLCIR
jgi:hypothetical protein